MHVRWLPAVLIALVSAGAVHAAAPQPETPEHAEYVRKMIPTRIAGAYKAGKLIELRVQGRMAFLVEPTGKVDPQKRWVWTFPFWLSINDGHGQLQHRFYAERLLAAGFHLAGIDVGTSCGSPSAAAVCQEFYQELVSRHGLNRRARLIVQSNGGLIGYAWAFRHADGVERIAGICPATDFRTWPLLPNVVAFPERGLDYGLTHEQLAARITQFNPIDNLRPLAEAGVKILHIHGDQDDLVPLPANSLGLAARYKKLGGSAEIVVLKGLGHGGTPLYESAPLLSFLLAD
jgi:Prolyl oligopeptidase family